MSANERVIVALDVPGVERALSLIDQIGPDLRWVKVGMELYYAAGPKLLELLKNRGLRVFLDLKVMDIPNTAYRAMAALARLGVDMVNVHCSGGVQMMQAAREGLLSAGCCGETAKLIAVTVLTSIDAGTLRSEIGIPQDPEQAVVRLAALAHKAGLDGVVASPREAATIKHQLGGGFTTVTPGIRPAWAATGDQARTAEPHWAASNGCDYLVVGRPITAHPDPAVAFQQVVAEINVGLERRQG